MSWTEDELLSDEVFDNQDPHAEDAASMAGTPLEELIARECAGEPDARWLVARGIHLAMLELVGCWCDPVALQRRYATFAAKLIPHALEEEWVRAHGPRKAGESAIPDSAAALASCLGISRQAMAKRNDELQASLATAGSTAFKFAGQRKTIKPNITR